MPEIDRGGVRITFDITGSGPGPALLLTHGFTASAHMFTGNLPALSANNTIITWDVRGHGRSDYPEDAAAYSSQLAVGDMVAILDAVGVERAVIGGHSLGGYLSLRFHLLQRHRVAGLVLIDTGPGYRQDAARDGWNTMAENYATSFERRGLDALGDSAEVSGDVHRDASGLIRAARGILTQFDAQVIESLPGIEVPTLVIVGEDDTPFLDGSRYMAAKIPGAQLAVIPDAGHAPNISNPQEFERVLTDFLANLQP
jgi:pimeloyl-ACP methyl ester carboxylesterase